MTNTLGNISARNIKPAFGLEIDGVDLSRPLPDDVADYIVDQFNQYSVLVFHNQVLDDEQQISFSRIFGTLEPTRVMTAASNRYVYHISNIDNRGNVLPADAKKRKLLEVNTQWHIDSSFKSPPAMASILSGREIPKSTVTRTEFCSLSHAYAALTDEQKKKVHGLTCLHDYNYSLKKSGDVGIPREELDALKPCKQPLVHIHPDKNVPCLYLSGHIVSIDGMTDDECRSLIDELFETVVSSDNVYEHTWQQDDLVIWDNRCIMHRANNIPVDEVRRVHRTTVRCPSPLIIPSATQL